MLNFRNLEYFLLILTTFKYYCYFLTDMQDCLITTHLFTLIIFLNIKVAH